MSSADTFRESGCLHVKGLVDTDSVKLLSLYFENKLRRGEINDTNCKKSSVSSIGYYADPLTEVFLLQYADKISNLIGKKVLPTYSYFRIYAENDHLSPHVDRPACEISATINVFTKSDSCLFFTKQGDQDLQTHSLNPGDAVVYKGCEVTHWRNVTPANDIIVQFMLHYVLEDGPNASHAKDKRPNYGFPFESRRA